MALIVKYNKKISVMSSFRPMGRRRTLLKYISSSSTPKKGLGISLSRFSASNVTHFCIHSKHSSGKETDHDLTHLYRINKILSQYYYDSASRVIYLFLDCFVQILFHFFLSLSFFPETINGY